MPLTRPSAIAPARPTPPSSESWLHVAGVLLLMPAIAGLCVGAVQVYLGQGLRPLPAALVAALALTAYALNRLTDHAEDARNHPRDAWVRLRLGGALLLVAALGAGASALALWRRDRLHPLYGLILVAGILYSYPLIPWYRRGGGLTLVRLKAVPPLKNLTIAATWCASVFLVPLLDGPPAPWRPSLVLLAVGYALMVWLNSFFCDLRDAAGDRVAGVPTLAVQLGPARADHWVRLLSIAWVAYLAGTYFSSDWLDLPHLVFLLASAIGYPTLVGLTRARLRLSGGPLDLVVESSDVLFAAGLLILARLS